MPLPPPADFYERGHYLILPDVDRLLGYCQRNHITIKRRHKVLLRMACKGNLPTNRHKSYECVLRNIYAKLMKCNSW